MILNDEILIYDAIASPDEYGYTAAEFAQEMNQLAGQRRLTIRINSPGGNVFAGLAIFDQLITARRLGRNITAYIDGAALSIASVIPLAANRVVMGSASCIMVHLPWAPGASGNADDLRQTIAALEAAEERLTDIYVAQTDQPRSVVRGWLAKETWFSASEALAVGLCDEISTAMPALAARCSLGAYAMPQDVWRKIREPADLQIAACYRELRDVPTARSYEDSCDAHQRALDHWYKLKNTPGRETWDLNVLRERLDTTFWQG